MLSRLVFETLHTLQQPSNPSYSSPARPRPTRDTRTDGIEPRFSQLSLMVFSYSPSVSRSSWRPASVSSQPQVSIYMHLRELYIQVLSRNFTASTGRHCRVIRTRLKYRWTILIPRCVTLHFCICSIHLSCSRPWSQPCTHPKQG